MQHQSPYLFVYGTLLSVNNPYGAYLQQHCSLYRQGKLKGRLYDFGEYPGAITGEHNGYIHGQIYRMDNPEEILKEIDAYEGFGPDQEQPNLFVRILTTVETEVNPVECWVYVYNLPVDEAQIIPSGRYVKI